MALQNKSRLFVKSKNLKNITIPILFFLTFFLVFFNKTDYYILEKFKTHSLDYIIPTAKIIAYPVNYAKKTINNITNLRLIEKENIRLREELIRLKKWQKLAIKNISENEAYKKLLNSTSNDLNIIKTASVIQHSPEFFMKSIIVNAGNNYQIDKNLAVINERGLVGKTITITNKNTKILLITDKNSSVPVKSYNREFFAILKGSNDGKYLESSFIKDKSKPMIGDILVTSGSANIFPENILVGKVVKIKNDKIITLPFVDTKNIKFVQILKKN
tara:strand:+ start:3821 stop:4642 length:822 start_codon:yes stop_codon:yes gene_type:complete